MVNGDSAVLQQSLVQLIFNMKLALDSQRFINNELRPRDETL